MGQELRYVRVQIYMCVGDNAVCSLVQARIDNNTLMVLVDGSDVTAELVNSNGTGTFGNNTVDVNRTSDTSLEVSFMSGVGVEVKLEVGLLSFVVRLPQQFMGQARGLLGNMDGNATNEFVYRNGTMIPDSSSDREIHNFGQSCKNPTKIFKAAFILLIFVDFDSLFRANLC